MKGCSPLRLTGRWVLLSGLAVLCLTDVKVDAATKKETPLANLAKGCMDVTDSEGQLLEKAELLTDEDKYYLEKDKEGNKL